jgi:predicted metal-dependent phosphoesterase TrpH
MAAFLIDPHVHTAETSSCSRLPAAELVRLYRSKGYDALIVTDHYFDEFFDAEGNGSLPWRRRVERYLAGFRNARREGERIGLRVFLGLEVRLSGSPNDYLVYGPDEEFLEESPPLFRLDLAGLGLVVRALGGALVQAHPFRPVCTRADPALLDGVEVFNGNPRHRSRNELAGAFARKHGLLRFSGSDAHQEEDVGRGGMRLPRAIGSLKEFLDCLGEAELLASPGAP